MEVREIFSFTHVFKEMTHSSLFFVFRVINEKEEEIELFSSVECKVSYC